MFKESRTNRSRRVIRVPVDESEELEELENNELELEKTILSSSTKMKKIANDVSKLKEYIKELEYHIYLLGKQKNKIKEKTSYVNTKMYEKVEEIFLSIEDKLKKESPYFNDYENLYDLLNYIDNHIVEFDNRKTTPGKNFKYRDDASNIMTPIATTPIMTPLKLDGKKNKRPKSKKRRSKKRR